MEPCRVRFVPSGKEALVAPGTTLYAAARGAGLPVASACQAEGICGRCGLRPLAGAENLSPETAAEQRVKAANRVSAGLRLSCLALVQGAVTATADYW